MTDINQWMILHKYAKNEFNAYAIFNGLQLSNTPRFWERVRRVVAYRQWRDAGEISKVSFIHALNNEKPPKTMFDKIASEAQEGEA